MGRIHGRRRGKFVAVNGTVDTLSQVNQDSSSGRADAAAFVLDRFLILFLGSGFLISVVGTGTVHGKLHVYDLLVGAIVGFLVLAWMVAPRLVPMSRSDALLMTVILGWGGIMAVVAATVLTNTPSPLVQVMFLARVAGLFLVFVMFTTLAARWPGTIQLAFVLTALFLLGYVARTLATGEFSGYYKYLDIPGTSAPLQSGYAFGILAVFFLGLAVIPGGWPRRLLFVSLSACLAFSAVGTVSRTNTLAVVAAISVMPVVLAIANGRYRQMLLLYLTLISALGIFLAVYLSGWLPESVNEPISSTLRRLSRIQASSNLRLRNWSTYFNDAPVPVMVYWLTGLGMGAQSVLSEVRAGFTLRFDSLYLRLFFEWGVVGLVLWFAFFLRLVTRVRHGSRSLLVPLGLVLVYGSVVGVTHEWLFVGVSGYLFMAIAGTLAGWTEYRRSVGYPSGAPSASGIHDQ